MTSGEQIYLVIVLATFGGFGLWVAYNTWRYDRSQAGRPEARRHEPAHHMVGASAD